MQHLLARLCDAFEPLAMPGENFDAKLLFQLNDGFGNAWLRGVQCLGSFRQVEVAPGSFLDKAELMKIHINLRLKRTFIMLQRDMPTCVNRSGNGNFGHQLY